MIHVIKYLLVMFVCFVCVENIYAQKDIWMLYSPVQPKIVGKTVLSRVKHGQYQGQMAFGRTNSDAITTEDLPSAGKITDEFRRDFGIGLTVFLGTSVKNTKVDVTNAKVTSITSSINKLNNGTFVIAALKAEKVTITITKNNNYKLTPSDLLSKISSFSAISDASAINIIKLVDSINYSTNHDIIVTMNDTSIYYAVQIAKKEQYFSDLDYLNLVSENNGKIELDDNDIESEVVYPQTSSLLHDALSSVGIDLIRKEDDHGNISLYSRATLPNGGTDDRLIPMIDKTHWSLLKFPVASFDFVNKGQKNYYLYIKAHLVNKKILVEEARLYYPEWIITILSENDI